MLVLKFEGQGHSLNSWLQLDKKLFLAMDACYSTMYFMDAHSDVKFFCAKLIDAA